MSGIFSVTPNYGGRQPDNVQNIKQFVTSISDFVQWIYMKINLQTVITPSDQTKDVFIPKNLIVMGSINNPSDITLKQNIEFITNQELNHLLDIKTVSFEYKNDETNKKHYGLIAQEIEPKYPNLVSNEFGFKTVNYIEIIPILIAKIQSMEKDIQMLKGTL